MPLDPSPATVLVFNASNRLAIRRNVLDLAFSGTTAAEAVARARSAFPELTEPAEFYPVTIDGQAWKVLLSQTPGDPAAPGVAFRSIEEIEAGAESATPALQSVMGGLDPYLADVPYLHLGENDFIYKFRPAPERNAAIYAQDAAAGALYQSQLCSAIKALARQQERTAAAPLTLDFGAIQYVIPSHFGFCLGVKNAIERAYETLAENPGRRVFMLSELIHNPFVNEDLLRRGLRYLQTDRGVPYTVSGKPAEPGSGEPLIWDTLRSEDIVIIPAFGATDEDKRRLVRKGISIFQYDATCMLVEKVWKAARAYGREGYTVVIHGKHEHEETKATFSNTRRHAPAVIVRDLDEARKLGELIAARDPVRREEFHRIFAGRYTPGFDVARHLDRVAVVNQTTLLMNETLAIIEHLRGVYRQAFGDEGRVGGSSRRDTLCYATQVNQDALSRALAGPLDAAFVIGGKNSSNTYQLFRLCEHKLGDKAFFIQSEANIRSGEAVEHYLYAGNGSGRTQMRPIWSDQRTPRRVLVTGGASCPDGIIQQVITRLNSFQPAGKLRSVADVLNDLGASGELAVPRPTQG